jgi:hypothetical protein
MKVISSMIMQVGQLQEMALVAFEERDMTINGPQDIKLWSNAVKSSTL